MQNLKSTFKLYDKGLMSHLNLFGMILFTGFYIISIINGKIISVDYLPVFIFFSIYSIGVADINNSVLPYKNKNPFLIYQSKEILFRHLFFSLIKLNIFQILLTLIMSLVTIVFIKDSITLILLVFSLIIIEVWVKTQPIIILIINKILFLLYCYIIFNKEYHTEFIILSIHILFLYFVDKYRPKISILNSTHSSRNFIFSQNSIKLCFLIISRNIWISFLLITILFLIGYFFDKINYFSIKLPIYAILLMAYLSVIDILIGNKVVDIMIDKSRISLFSVNPSLDIKKKFTNSSLFVIYSIFSFFGIFSVLGSFFSNYSLNDIIKNIFFIIMGVIVTLIYYQKTELLLKGYKNTSLRFTLIFFILILAFFISIMGV